MYLSPRDQFSLFDAPVATLVHVATTVTPVAPENPDRVALYMFSVSGSDIFLSWESTLTTGRSLKTNGTLGPLILRQKDDMNLCQLAWYGITSGVTLDLIVWEVLLRRYPEYQ